jgi:hypothetical protein
MAHGGSGSRRQSIGLWSSNVGYLLAFQVAEGGGAWVCCSRCKTWEPVDLAKLIIKRNPLFSLWDRRPPCPTCKSPLSFHAHHAPAARVIPLHNEDPAQSADLHRAWERERRRAVGIPEL